MSAKRVAHNKTNVHLETRKIIRNLFVKQKMMVDIEKKTGLTERVIRRIIKEHSYACLRERYLKYLCYKSCISGESLKSICSRVGVMYMALCRIRRKFSVEKYKRTAWNKKITEHIKSRMIEDYKYLTAEKICKKYGFKTSKTVLDVLKENHIETRQCHTISYHNQDFFNSIDCHEKAYILGLLYTDGYIVKDYGGFAIQLTESDGYLLHKISKLLSQDNIVYKVNCDSKRKKCKNTKDMVRLLVTSKKMAEDLRRLGVVKRKSKILRYNNVIPKHFLSSFIRGLIDGDGTIFVKNGFIHIKLCSASIQFLKDISAVCSDFQFSLTTFVLNEKSTIYNLYLLGGKEQSLKFLKWIYKDKSDLYLRRKYDKVKDQIC